MKTAAPFTFAYCLPFFMPRIRRETIGKMEEFYGKKYVLVNSENFDQLLIFIEIAYVQRQIAMALRPTQYVTKNEDGTYSIHFRCTLVNSHFEFTPGVEFDEKKPDGSVVRSLVSIVDNKILHRQTEPNGRTLNHEYEFFPDKMVVTTTAPGLSHVVKRYYAPVD